MKRGESFDRWARIRNERFEQLCQAIREGVIRCANCQRAFRNTKDLKHDLAGRVVCRKGCRRKVA